MIFSLDCIYVVMIQQRVTIIWENPDPVPHDAGPASPPRAHTRRTLGRPQLHQLLHSTWGGCDVIDVTTVVIVIRCGRHYWTLMWICGNSMISGFSRRTSGLWFETFLFNHHHPHQYDAFIPRWGTMQWFMTATTAEKSRLDQFCRGRLKGKVSPMLGLVLPREFTRRCSRKTTAPLLVGQEIIRIGSIVECRNRYCQF